jgi:hypothetical protein
VLFSSNSARYVAGRQDVLQYSHSKGYEQTKATKLNKTKKKGEPKRKEKQKMYTVTFSNEELEEMKANDAVVIVSCDDDNGHRLY